MLDISGTFTGQLYEYNTVELFGNKITDFVRNLPELTHNRQYSAYNMLSNGNGKILFESISILRAENIFFIITVVPAALRTEPFP